MNDSEKSKEELVQEIAELRRQVAELEAKEPSQTENGPSASLLLEASPLGIHVCDAQGKITIVNRAQAAITGYSADELVGTHIWDRIEPGFERDSLSAYIEHLVADQPPPKPYNGRNIRKNGEAFDCRIDWDYMRNGKGEVIGFVSIVSDVTEQKRIEEALRQSEDRYRNLAESTTDMIYIANRSGDILYANRSAAACLGCDAIAIVGKRQQDIFPPEMVARHTASIAYVFQSGEVFEADGIYHFGPQEIWLNTRLMPLRNERGEVVAVMGVSRNITDRKRAEEALRQAHDELEQRVEERTAELAMLNEALRQSHDEFRAIYDRMTDGILIVDAEQVKILRANAAFCSMLGCSEDDVYSLSPEKIHPPEILPEVMKALEAIKQGRSDCHENVPFLRADGKKIYADVATSPIRYNQKSCWITFFHEVTERKRAEEEILRAKREWERTFNSVPDLIAVLDQTSHIIRVNRAMADRLGLPADQCIGLKCCEQVHGLHNPPEFCPNALTLSDGKGHAVEIHEDRLGGDFLVTTTPIFDDKNQLIGSVHIARDITEQKRAQEALQQSEEKYRGLIELCPDAVVLTDLDVKIIFVSREAWKMLDLPEEVELVGHRAYDFVIEEDRPKLAKNIAGLIQKGEQTHFEYTMLRPNGTTAPMEISSALVRDARGRPAALMAIVRDITDRKQVEEALKKEHRTLKHLLQSSDHERQLIAYEIHDGLAQELAGAIMQLEAFSGQKDKMNQEIAKAFETATTLLRQAHFEVRRLISGVRPPILDESGLVAAVAHLVNEHKFLNGPKIELRTEVTFHRLVPILENAIYRIIQEGLANACKHAQSPIVSVDLLQHRDVLTIQIKDWGIGFEPEKVQEDRYGLQGIRERARLLGGKTILESSPKKGTCLTVELPLVLKE